MVEDIKHMNELDIWVTVSRRCSETVLYLNNNGSVSGIPTRINFSEGSVVCDDYLYCENCPLDRGDLGLYLDPNEYEIFVSRWLLL